MQGPKLRQCIEEGEENLVQTGEAHPGLELDTGRADDTGVGPRRKVRGGIQKLGLADTWLACYEQGPTIPTDRRHERGEPIQLGIASHEVTGGATAASPRFLS